MDSPLLTAPQGSATQLFIACKRHTNVLHVCVRGCTRNAYVRNNAVTRQRDTAAPALTEMLSQQTWLATRLGQHQHHVV